MIKLNSPGKNYLQQQLEWVKHRRAALDKIETKLSKMRNLAEYARDNHLNPAENQKIETVLQILQSEITELDEKSRVFWSGCQ